MMIVTQDTKTTFDLGGNPTEIKFYDYQGWAYTETRTYAKGYQITNATFSARAGVTATTSGSFTYDGNGNMLTSKGVTIYSGTTQFAYRANWTFEFDEANRLKNFTHANTDDKRWIWYDGRERVWQRWTQNKEFETWPGTLNRYVYDGGALSQEHQVGAQNVSNAWVYTYTDLTRDYLRKPGGIRQIERSGASDTYRFLLTDGGATPTARIEKDSASVVQRMELSASGERQMTGSTQTTQISNIGPGGGYIEAFSSTSGQTSYFDPLVQYGNRHAISGYGRWLTLKGNNAQIYDPARVSIRQLQAGQTATRSIKWSWLPLPSTTDACETQWSNTDFCQPNIHPCMEVQEDEYGGLLTRHTTGWFDFCCLPTCLWYAPMTIGKPYDFERCV